MLLTSKQGVTCVFTVLCCWEVRWSGEGILRCSSRVCRLTRSKKPERGRIRFPIRPNVLNEAKNCFMAKGFA